MDCSLPGSSVHGIFQAIVLEWIAISFSRAQGHACMGVRTGVCRQGWGGLVQFLILDKLFVGHLLMGFPGGSDGKASVYNAGDLGSIPGSGRSSGE